MIFSYNPCISKNENGTQTKSVCTKFVNGDKEISIHYDNSFGTLDDLSRSEIRCYDNRKTGTDRTVAVFGERGTVYATIENFDIAWSWLMDVTK